MKGSELRDIRKLLRLTQAQLAEQLGVHWNSIARQERGEIGIRESLARLARVLVNNKPKRQNTKKGGR